MRKAFALVVGLLLFSFILALQAPTPRTAGGTTSVPPSTGSPATLKGNRPILKPLPKGSSPSLHALQTSSLVQLSTLGYAYMGSTETVVSGLESIYVFHISRGLVGVAVVERVNSSLLNVLFYNVSYTITYDGISFAVTQYPTLTISGNGLPTYVTAMAAGLYGGRVHFFIGYSIRNSTARVPWWSYILDVYFSGGSTFQTSIFDFGGRIVGLYFTNESGTNYLVLGYISMYVFRFSGGNVLAGNATIEFYNLDSGEPVAPPAIIDRTSGGFFSASVIPQDMAISNVIYDPASNVFYLLASVKWGAADSELYRITLQGTIYSKARILASEDLSSIPDFGESSITWTSGTVTAVLHTPTETQDFIYILRNVQGDPDWSKLNGTQAPKSPFIVDTDTTDNLFYIFYSDIIRGATAVYYSPANTSVELLTPEEATRLNTSTIAFWISSLGDEVALAHISLTSAGNTAWYLTILMTDTDRDALSDEFENVRGYNATNPDTDGDNITDGSEFYVYKTNVANIDSDGDNITDYSEITRYLTNATNPDTDGDNITDWEEIFKYSSNPLVADTDGDGLSDWEELVRGYIITIYVLNGTKLVEANRTVFTSPTSPDTDGDNITDMAEIQQGTDASRADTDGDNITDMAEIASSTSPVSQDTDGDGLSDWEERELGTDPTDKDSDDDGVNDGEEVLTYGTNPLSEDTDSDGFTDWEEIFRTNTSALLRDTDGDNLSDWDELEVYHTDPLVADTDGDGLSDWNETSRYHTSPTKNDTDGDNLSDWEEVEIIGTDPLVADTDGDGLSDWEEVNNPKLDPLNPDTDGDGLSDWEEVVKYGTYPDVIDTDQDNVTDSKEVILGTKPLVPDTDKDGIPDGQELQLGTDPLNPDTDGDGLSDGYEVGIGLDPLSTDTDNDGVPDRTELDRGLNPFSNDTDGDGLSDGFEIRLGTQPLSNDTDGDGLSDYEEVKVYGTDPLNPDTDGDGLSDGYEAKHKMSAERVDTDGDGLSDYEEVKVYGTDPLNPDTDGDGLSDYEEVKVKSSNPLSKDTDGDGIPDNDDPFPRDNDIYRGIIALVMIVGSAFLVHARSVGTFRDWRKDIMMIGLADEGGTPMLVVPEDKASELNVNMVSSALVGMYMLNQEIAGTKDILVMGRKPATVVVSGDNFYLWAVVRQSYKKLESKLKVLTKQISEKYRDYIIAWVGETSMLEPVKEYLESVLGPRTEEEKEEVSEEVKELLEELEKV